MLLSQRRRLFRGLEAARAYIGSALSDCFHDILTQMTSLPGIIEGAPFLLATAVKRGMDSEIIGIFIVEDRRVSKWKKMGKVYG